MYKRFFMYISACILASSTAYAETPLKESLAKCAVVAGDLDRLSCFDGITKAAGLDGPQPQPVKVEGVGEWVVNKDKNPIDDSERVVIGLAAKSGEGKWGKPIMLIGRCQSNTTELYISWGTYLGNDSGSVYSDWKNVTVRVGDQPARKERWGVSSDKQGTFAPDWAGTLLKEMSGHNSFIAQVVPYGESPITAIFDITGMENALAPLRASCGW